MHQSYGPALSHGPYVLVRVGDLVRVSLSSTNGVPRRIRLIFVLHGRNCCRQFRCTAYVTLCSAYGVPL